MNRAIIIILDGIGVGELPDARLYSDEGSDTLGNLARAVKGLRLPTLEAMGLGCIRPIMGIQPVAAPLANFGKMAEKSAGKDSTTGHWELAGLIVTQPFPLYPNGFPREIISEFEQRSGFGVIGNYPASGTEIIKKLGSEHLRSGKLIVYTSADSVFQIAAHEEIVTLDNLYSVCRLAREILSGDHAVARVIARPFIGEPPANFRRTENRKDFSLLPFKSTMLNLLQDQGIPTVGIGKINDLYAHQGIRTAWETKNNREGMNALRAVLDLFSAGLIMANLVDFDMLWGHRNDPPGLKAGLEIFDRWLADFIKKLEPHDLLILTSDHGNDPTTPGTDHSREYVPLLVYGRSVKAGINLGTRKCFADLAASVLDFFEITETLAGESFLPAIR
jgi:phosphopentomutase